MSIFSFFTKLRPSFIIGFIVAWNILCFGGMQLNGGAGPIKTLPSAALFFLAAAIAATAGFGPLLSSHLRSIVLRPNAELSQARPGLIFFGILGLLLMVGAAITAASIASHGSAA